VTWENSKIKITEDRETQWGTKSTPFLLTTHFALNAILDYAFITNVFVCLFVCGPFSDTELRYIALNGMIVNSGWKKKFDCN
jgi:hypothetical protein